MALLLLGVGAVGVGFGLLLLISLSSRRADASAATLQAPGGFLATLEAEVLGRLLTDLLEKLGFEDEDLSVGEGRVEILAVSPAPVTGGRLYLRGIAGAGVVDSDQVRAALETALAERAGRALLATGGTFSEGARSAAAGEPIELLDGRALLALVKKHLPAVAATGRVN